MDRAWPHATGETVGQSRWQATAASPTTAYQVDMTASMSGPAPTTDATRLLKPRLLN